MDLKEKRKQEGWKQQFIWLEPKSVEILEKLKGEEGKTYQQIINSLIQGQGRGEEETRGTQEENIEEIIERIIERKLGTRTKGKENEGYITNPQEIVGFIEKYRNDGFTWEDISNKLNDMGFRTETGKLWKRKSVNDFYKKWKG